MKINWNSSQLVSWSQHVMWPRNQLFYLIFITVYIFFWFYTQACMRNRLWPLGNECIQSYTLNSASRGMCMCTFNFSNFQDRVTPVVQGTVTHDSVTWSLQAYQSWHHSIWESHGSPFQNIFMRYLHEISSPQDMFLSSQDILVSHPSQLFLALSHLQKREREMENWILRFYIGNKQ